ncbi:MAG: hypothetical protein JXR73_07835 [Candidatus Omnitrophica bacterium]|nr:hypothetical protein [Candidatus Omnitrophota bacterium]
MTGNWAALFFMVSGIMLYGGAAWSEEGVIFSDDFESGSLELWDADSVVNDPNRLRLTSDPEHVFRGKYAVEIIARVGKGTGGKLNKWFLPGYDRVYARWYCKFAEDFDQGNHMHFCHLLANRHDDKWSAFGKAGVKPGGDDFFTAGLEPWRDWGKNPAPGEMMFYSYHLDMPIDSKMGKYWGEMFRPSPRFIPERGRWYCMEMMVKANTPGKADGEQAFWIDGDLKGRFNGIRWRDAEELKINDFWLMLYVHNSSRINRVWFDEVVIDDEYIGPVTE